MHRLEAVLMALAAVAPAAEFSGARALEYTSKAVSFGPRPPNSEGSARLRSWIRAQLKATGCRMIEDRFQANTPIGSIPMENIIAKFPGTSGSAVVFSGHYDTKIMPGTHFVGANDGGSSTGFLLEMARVLSGRRRKHDVYLVWFDGEEAIAQWSATDGLHGSRHLADRWARDGTLSRIRALINVDMIGDSDLGILQEVNSSPSLRRLIWQTAAELGYSRYFLSTTGAIEDDHIPFVRKGVNACNLIDFDYPYWHTDKDTVDKLSASSFEVVGRVLVEVLRRLEN